MKGEIIRLCATLFAVPVEDIMSPKRNQRIVEARFAFYAALRMRGWSYPRIGKFLGRDHATVMYGVQRAEYIMERHPLYKEKVEKISMWQPEIVKVPGV